MNIDLFNKLKKMSVLLIDGDQWIRSSLEHFFREKTSLLLAFEDAELALEHLKEKAYDIIICEYKLPGMNGLDFFQLSKKIQPNTMKILVIPYANLEITIKAVRAEIHDFIQKPFTTHTIERSLAKLIEKPERKGQDIHIDGEIQLGLMKSRLGRTVNR